MNQAPSTSARVDMCLLLTVSISIPAFTEDAVIERCLIAAAEQTLLGLEIIVTLGGPAVIAAAGVIQSLCEDADRPRRSSRGAIAATDRSEARREAIARDASD